MIIVETCSSSIPDKAATAATATAAAAGASLILIMNEMMMMMTNSTEYKKKDTTADADPLKNLTPPPSISTSTPPPSLKPKYYYHHHHHDQQQQQQQQQEEEVSIGTRPPPTSQMVPPPQLLRTTRPHSPFNPTFFRMEHHITNGRHNNNNNSDDDVAGSLSLPSSSSSSFSVPPKPIIEGTVTRSSSLSSSSSTTTTETYGPPPSRGSDNSRNKRRKIKSDSFEKIEEGHHHHVEEVHSYCGFEDRDQLQYHHENRKHHFNDDDDDHTNLKDDSSRMWQAATEGVDHRERIQEERLVMFSHHASSNAFATATKNHAYADTATSATSSTIASMNENTTNKTCLPRHSRPIGKIVFVTKTKTIESLRDKSSSSSSLQSPSPPDFQSVQKSQPQIESRRHHHHRHHYHHCSHRVDEVHVEVVSIFVRKEFRGRKLGKILFNEMVNMLRRRYGNRRYTGTTTATTATATERVPAASTKIRITLDAEEDVRCYNRLVNFYRDLGCTDIRANNNNNNININDDTIGNNAGKKTTYPGGDLGHDNDITTVSNTTQQNHPPSSVNTERFVYNSTGDVCYRRVPMELIIDLSDQQGDSRRDHHHHHLHHHPDQGVTLHTDYRSMYISAAPLYHSTSQDRPPSLIEDRPTLSFVPDTFLSSALDLASFPRANQESITLEDALLHAKNAPVTFSCEMSDNINSDISLRRFCFQLAELARDAGHPDWFQLTAMICCLGSILRRNYETYEKKNGLSDMVGILKNSSIGLPEESFDLLRSFFVYVEACSNGTSSMKPEKSLSSSMAYPSSVMDLYEIIHLAETKMARHNLQSQRPTRSGSEGTAAATTTTTTVAVVSESHCDELWDEYYSFVAMKYDAMKYLKW